MIDQEEVHKKCINCDPRERIKASNQLKDNFPSLFNKEQAWYDFCRLAVNKDSDVQLTTISDL